MTFATQMSAHLGIPVIPVQQARAAVAGADIVVTATTAREPIIDGTWFAEGVHINCVSAGILDRRELDDTRVNKCKRVDPIQVGGNRVEDVAAAAWAYERAWSLGLGQSIELGR